MGASGYIHRKLNLTKLMGQKTPITQSFNLPDGREVTLETGKLATQADGSCVIRMGKTMLFASVVSAHKPREGQSFFPLSVDYQEKYAAVGRIPGNFFRREARLSDYEILCSRLVDRALRPLFPDGYMNDTQIIINLISADKEVMPDAMVALAASTALAVSDIPFAGPISEVRVAKIAGKYIVNPDRTALEGATLNIIVAASLDNVMMVEGDGKEVDEKELVDAIKVGHDAIKVQVQAQLDLAQKVGEKATVKRVIEPAPENDEVKAWIESTCKAGLEKVCRGALAKHERKAGYKEVKEAMKTARDEKFDADFLAENGSFFGIYFNKLQKHIIRELVLSERIRLDGRKPEDVRPIWTEVDYLPSAHGSAIFNRGETQALASLTLGSKLDQAMVDTALDMHYENFILHYNFPAYSVGETRPMRGPGRREVGHANLAARSLKQVLPAENAYTIRIVADILESNGSSSMATVCSGSLALMDAGIKITAPVSGIAMGMVSDGDRAVILSDILGDEDAIGDMDFKVTGTAKGITGCQMDIKIDGLPYEQLEAALEQARVGRLHILDCMAESLSAPREDYKPHAPRIVKLVIDKTFIGAVIGPGGKIIQEMQESTGTTINIEEADGKGIIHISSPDRASIDKALERINQITYSPSVGDVWEAKVVTLMPDGVFVEWNGQSGLLHISEIDHSRIEDVSSVFKEGDMVKVKLIGIDERSGKFRLSRKVLMDKPERKDS